MTFSSQISQSLARATAAAAFAILPLCLAAPASAAPKGKAAAAAKGKATAASGKSGKASRKAPASSKSVALGAITGTKAKDVRGWVRGVLESNFELTDAEDFKPKGDDASYAKMARDLGVDAVVVGKIEKKRLLLSVRGADGTVIAELEFKSPPGPKLKAAIQKRLGPKLTEKLGSGAAEPPAAPAEKPEEDDAADEGAADEPTEDASEDKENESSREGDAEAPESESTGASAEGSASASSSSAFARSPFDLRVGLKVSMRKFTYQDRLQDLVPSREPAYRLNNYDGGTDLALVARLEFYPGALLGAEGLAADLGLVAGIDFGMPSKTQYRPKNDAPRDLDNSASEWYLGLRGRVPLSSVTDLGFTGTYGKQSYTLKGDEALPLVPDVSYSYMRLGADMRTELGKILLELRVGGRFVTSTGQIEEQWFPNASAFAFDAGLNVGYMFTQSLGVIAGAEFLNYGMNFNPIAKDSTRVAGGAVDRYLSGWVGGRFTLPGSK